MNLLHAVLISACSEDEPKIGLNAYDESVIQYFNEIALGFEFGSERKLPENGKPT
jgi:hypothetical protein